MSQPTKIEWTHWPDGLPGRTWNAVRGCSRVSEGCRHCYAERVAARFSGDGVPFGENAPFYGFAERRDGEPRWTGLVKLIADKLDEPLRTRKPSRWFVNSMSDLFHEALPDEAILDIFGVMAAASHHYFLILTKRAARMRELVGFFSDGDRWSRVMDIVRRSRPDVSCSWPLPHVALGVSVEDQATADERIPELLVTPAAMRFVSYEPALGPANFQPFLGQHGRCEECGPVRRVDEDGCCLGCGSDAINPGLDWIIVGGESGPGARPFDVAWARSTIEQCREAGVPAFFKQAGSNAWSANKADHLGRIAATSPMGAAPIAPEPLRLWLRDRKGADPAEWPEDLRVREFPR